MESTRTTIKSRRSKIRSSLQNLISVIFCTPILQLAHLFLLFFRRAKKSLLFCCFFSELSTGKCKAKNHEKKANEILKKSKEIVFLAAFLALSKGSSELMLNIENKQQLSDLTKLNRKSIDNILYRLEKKGCLKIYTENGEKKAKIEGGTYEFAAERGSVILLFYGFNLAGISSSNIYNININNIHLVRDTIASSIEGSLKTDQNSPLHARTPSVPTWSNIDTSALAHIGFTRHHARQLKNFSTPEVVQTSILQFAYALKHNPRVKKYAEPVTVLMGVLRRGGAWVEPSYHAEIEKNVTQVLEDQARQKRLSIEKIENFVQEMMNSEYRIWQESRTPQELSEILPPELQKTPLKGGIDAYLKRHFRTHVVMPQLRKMGVVND